MIGGLAVDVLLLAAVLAFAWAGTQLGGVHAVGRAVAAYAGFALAALVRDPVGSLVGSALGTSLDLSRLLGMILVGIASFFAVLSLFGWWHTRRQLASVSVDEDDDELLVDPPDPLSSTPVAAVGGGLLGLAWVLLFVSMLVLMPTSNIVSRSAMQSFTGGIFIEREHALRWMSRGFPHYTQQLPKGEDGAVVGDRGDILMVGEVEPTSQAGDADPVLRSINRSRRAGDIQALTYNNRLADIARRHAISLVRDQQLRYTASGGAPLDGRIRAALGQSADSFGDAYGIEVVWSHGPANAGKGLRENDDAAKLLNDPSWSEVGIGVADAGWFNGRIYVILLVADARDGLEGAAGEVGAASAAGTDDPTSDGDGVSPADANRDAAALDQCAGAAIDLDGDGVVDEESVDRSPACPAVVDETLDAVP